MNEELEKFSRDSLVQTLGWCTAAQRHVFTLMYSPDDLTLPIKEVVMNMPVSTLDWAMTQTANTLRDNGYSKEE